MAMLARTPQDSRRISGSAAVLLAGVAALAGTGGVTRVPTEVGYTLPGVRWQSDLQTGSSSVETRRIVAELGVSHAAMARILGVSRQTWYNWLNGAEPNPLHRAKLAALGRVHGTLSTLDVPIRALLTQPLRERQSFWQLVQAGEDPEPLAQLIRAKYESRASQRALVAERLTAKRGKGALALGTSDDLT